MLSNGPIQVGPGTVQVHIRFVHAPRSSNRLPIGTGSRSEQREEALDPALDGAAIDGEAALRELRDQIRIPAAVPDRVAHRQGNHVVREGMSGEGTP